MNSKTLFAIGIGLALLGIIYLLSGGIKPATDNSEFIKVAASFAPISDIARQVGGNKIEVVQLLPDGSSPHTYEPLASDQIALAGTEIAFLIGLDFDNWAVAMLDASAPEAKTITLERDIALKASDETGSDPHYWLSYTNAKQMADTIAVELGKFDAPNKDFYLANASAFKASLDTDRKLALEKISQLSDKGIVTFHDAFSYFATDLGLNILTSIEPYPGKEPSAQYLAEVGEVVKTQRVKVLFKEPQLSDSLVTALAQDYGILVETLDPAGSKTLSYRELMQYNVDTIVKALQ